MLASCGDGAGSPATSNEKPRPAEIDIPSHVLGLEVRPEDISKEVEAVRSATYVDSVAVFTFREGDLLQAGLQVASFNDSARPKSEKFRRQVIALVGTGAPEILKVGDRKVFTTFGTQQTVYTWFAGDGFFVLTARKAYPFRRTLLRRLLVLEGAK